MRFLNNIENLFCLKKRDIEQFRSKTSITTNTQIFFKKSNEKKTKSITKTSQNKFDKINFFNN